MDNKLNIKTNTILMGERIYLRFFEEKDLKAILNYRIKNHAFLQQFSPEFSDNYTTLEGVKHYLESQKELIEKDQNYSFGVFLKENNAFIGDVDFFHIQRGPVQKCMIGYALDQEHNGYGFMTEAVKLAVGFAFESSQ